MKNNFEKTIQKAMITVTVCMVVIAGYITQRSIQIEAKNQLEQSQEGKGYRPWRKKIIVNKIVIPDFAENSLEDFENWALENEVIYTIEYEYSDGIKENLIIAHHVDGTNEVVVVVSKGIDYGMEVTLPNFSGMTVEQIQEFVKKNHLADVSYNYISDANIAAGNYISINTSKTKIKRSEKIVITISLGKKEDIAAQDNQVEVIDFSRMTKNDVDDWGVKNRINIVYSNSFSDSVSKGNVISQSIARGVKLEPNATIAITLSLGKQIVISDFSNRPYSEFVSWRNVQDGQLIVTRLNDYHNTIARDNIISNTPKSGTLNSGDNVNVVVSLGRPTIKNHVGRPLAELNSEIAFFNNGGANLSVQVQEEYNNQAAGTIISQDKSGAVDIGTVIVVRVSKGTVTIPAFTTESQATMWARENGFNIGVIVRVYSNEHASGMILNQTPAANTSRLPGSVSISLTVSLGKPSVKNHVGRPLAELNSEVATFNNGGANLSVQVQEEYSSQAAGTIISQDKSGVMDIGTTIVVRVSIGSKPPEPVMIPVFTSEAEANLWIKENGFMAGKVEYAYSNQHAAAVLFDQTPAGNTSHLPGSVSITFKISLGKPNIPSFVGLDMTGAVQGLAPINNANGRISIRVISYEHSSTVEVGRIIRQSIIGPADVGTTVEVVLSMGVEPPSGVVAENYVGLNYGDAVQLITRNNLSAFNSSGDCSSEWSVVTHQSVESGQRVPVNTEIDLRCENEE